MSRKGRGHSQGHTIGCGAVSDSSSLHCWFYTVFITALSNKLFYKERTISLWSGSGAVCESSMGVM